MRVITGTCRGRKLKTPAGDDVRPTTDNVKEAIFNIIASDVEGRRVLDLFAGTGQLGIEALSRGAREAVFVELIAKDIAIFEEGAVISEDTDIPSCLGLFFSVEVSLQVAIKFLDKTELKEVVWESLTSQILLSVVVVVVAGVARCNDRGFFFFLEGLIVSAIMAA